MGELSRRESREAFRDFIWQNVPEHLRTRTWQMLQSIVFTQEPILRELQYFEVRDGSGAPTSSEYPEDGFGMWLDNDSDTIYVVLKWKDEFYNLGGSGAAGGEINTASNLGAGIGTYAQKVARDLQFNSLVSQNAYLTIGLDGANHEIDFTVNLSAIETGLTAFVRRDGTLGLTADWDAGDHEIRAGQLYAANGGTYDGDIIAEGDLTVAQDVEVTSGDLEILSGDFYGVYGEWSDEVWFGAGIFTDDISEFTGAAGIAVHNDLSMDGGTVLTVPGPGTPAAPAVDFDSSYMKVGHVGVAGSNPTATHMLYGTEQYINPGANVVGIGFFPKWRQTAPATNTLWGVQGNVFFSGGGFGNNSQVVGLQFFPAPDYVEAGPYGNFALETFGIQTGGCINVLAKQVKLRECTGIATAGFVEIFGGAGASQIIDAWGIKVGDSVTPTVGGFFTRLTGVEIEKQTAAASNIGLFMNGDGVGADIVFGAGKDAHMHYDGSDFILDTSLISPSDFLLECGTEKTLELVTTVWDDLRIVPGAFQFQGSSDPSLIGWSPGASTVTFQVYAFRSNNEVFFTCQLPHTYKQGTDIEPHVHWTPHSRGVAESGQIVGWRFDYSWANVNTAFPTNSTAYLADTCTGTDDYHEISPSVAITGTGKLVSSMLVCRLWRDTSGTDDWVGTTAAQSPALLEFDIHFEVNTLGSRQTFVK